MKVLIEARSLSASAGVKTYTEQLIRHLLKLGTHEYTIVYDQARHQGTFPQAHEVVLPNHSALLLPWWLQVKFPQLIAKLQPDIVHFTKADVPRKGGCPALVTIYDVIPLLFPQSQPFLQKVYWPRALHRAATASEHIMTISEASKKDIMKYLGVPADKITVTPLAADTNHFTKATVEQVARVREKYQITPPYLLFVGTQEPRKNIPALLRSFATIAHDVPHQLVLAGKKGWKFQAVKAQLRRLPIRHRITELAYVDYADLPALYSGADVFVWPSVYEGWGLPVQEAMACGTPVIVSNGGALPEVVGPAGIVVPFTTADVPARLHDQAFEQQFALATAALLADPARQQQLGAAGRAQSQRATWEAVALATMRQYDRMSVFL